MARALILKDDPGGIQAALEDVEPSRLPKGDVLVTVLYSSLNYKDALAVTGKGKIIRGEYPFIPGIDLVGRVEDSASDQYDAGDLVIGTGWGLGESRWGGYSELQRVESSMIVPLPDGMTPRAAMVVGTAGFTAMLSLMALEDRGAAPPQGEILVTGASGGVGSMAVALLHQAGFTVTASTGSANAHDYLHSLGASRIVDRSELDRGPQRPMDSARWAGAVDVVGGKTLASIISRLQRHASVAVCGLAGGAELHTTVYPFILRGANLLGIDSNTCPNDVRRHAWHRLSNLLDQDLLERVTAATISIEEIPEFSRRLLGGGVQGRVVVEIAPES